MEKVFLNQKRSVNAGGENAQITCCLLLALREALEPLSGLTTGKLILEDVKSNDGGAPHYVFSAMLQNGEGLNCAEEKIAALRENPKAVSTKDLILKTGKSYQGGVAIHYIGYEGEGLKPIDGVFRIAFSGADPAIDLYLALFVAKAYIVACDKYCGISNWSYDTEALKSEQLLYWFAKDIGLVS